MQIDVKSGLVADVDYIESPNCDERPDPEDLSLIVIHNISLPPGEFGGQWITDLFTNRLDPKVHPYFEDICQMEVSAHVLIQRNGHIIQYVPFHRRAWHAGKSNYCGRERCNDFAVGIELEGADDQDFETAQYESLATLINALIKYYPKLTLEHITGHSDIAPGRKTDPGPHFQWGRLRNLLKTG